MQFKIIKISSLILVIVVLSLLGLFGYYFNSVNAQTPQDYDLAGWVWSKNYGWISLNSQNCLVEGVECTGYGQDYGVKINSSNEIAGYGWSENVGWVCFGNGNGDDTKGCINPLPPVDSLTTAMDQNNGAITGWAQIVEMDQDGWIKIGRGEPSGGANGEMCYDCQPKCDVWTMVDDGSGNLVPTAPCVTYSEVEFDSCKTCFTQTNFNGVDYPIGQDPDPSEPNFVVGGSGYVCTNCNNCRKEDNAGVSRMVCNIDSGGWCSTCNLYGANRNSADGSLLGWGWNGDGSNGQVGAGWLHFNPESGSSYIVFPWLQTIYGSIYTPKDIRQKAGVGGMNATYCLFANDINVNVKTQNCEGIASGLIKDVNVGFPEKKNGQEVYRNALGKVDINGLETKTKGEKNKYGNVVYDISGNWNGPPSGILNGAVYNSTGNVVIPASGIVFNSIQNSIGNGIIIVNGNLNIEGDVSYNLTAPTKLQELASVVWVVKGDVIVNPSVKHVAGAFIVLGSGNSCSKVTGSDFYYPNYEQNGCGVFFSGESNQSLTVYGLVVAKAFDFRRTFTTLLQGSERVIYDGRLIANPPKGLNGFLEGLPVIRDFSY